MSNHEWAQALTDALDTTTTDATRVGWDEHDDEAAARHLEQRNTDDQTRRHNR